MKLTDTVASVKLDGRRHLLSPGMNVIGGMKFHVALENPAENFYSWVVYAENDSDEKSPRIQELLGLDVSVPVIGAAKLNTLRGDDCSIRSFLPESFDLTEGETVTREPLGARSSNTTAFPYFDLEDEKGDGLVCGIGWSGQWKLDVTREGDAVRLAGGFRDCDFILEPHEKVRSIRVLIYFGKGGVDTLRNEFVHLHRKYYSPVPEFDGNTWFPIATQCFDRYYWGNIPENGKLSYFESEDAQFNIIKNAAKCRYFNAFWLDACWFDGAFRTGVGNYAYSTGFPNGLKKIGDLAHRNGMRFILWFEPVRAMPGTDIFVRFHEDGTKIIPDAEENSFFVNLGDPDVLQYQIDHISAAIEENGVDMYREDFNIDPYEYLKSIETPDRVGISQIRFVEGLYTLWDSLRERFPGLMIDDCASGGRLIDVETMMRAIPLWRSDMGCRPSPNGMQNEILTLSRYLPYHQGGCFDQSPYFLRSSFTTGVACGFPFLYGIIDPEKEENSLRAVCGEHTDVTAIKHIGEFEPDRIAKVMKDVLALREYWNGDFYALTPPAEDKKAILAYTLRLREEDRGVVLVFRREEAEDTFVIRLPEINREKMYDLVLSDENLEETRCVLTGAELAEGFTVKIGEAPGSLLVKYCAKN